MKRTAYRSRDAYAQVNWEMVAETGGDIVAAVVFDWIAWKADAQYGGIEDADGTAWYETSYPALATTMNVTEKVIRRALTDLVASGHLEATMLRLGGAYDRTKAYRPVWDDTKATTAAEPAAEDAPGNDESTPDSPLDETAEPSAPEGRCISPEGRFSSAPEGASHLPLRADVPIYQTLKDLTDKELLLTDGEQPELPGLELTVEEHFEIFWKAWPRNDAKKMALAKFVRAARKRGAAQIVNDAAAWLAQRPDLEPAFVPYAATWLNQERWDDEAPTVSTHTAPTRRHQAVQTGFDLIAHFENEEHPNGGPDTDRKALDDGRDLRPGDTNS